MSFAEKVFRLSENKTSVRQEVMAGITTFVTMAYVIFVVPSMVSETGMPRDALFAATIWATALSTGPTRRSTCCRPRSPRPRRARSTGRG